MKRFVFTLAAVAAVAVFGFLAIYGWTHRYGAPVGTTVLVRPILRAAFVEKPLNLDEKAPIAPVWENAQSVNLPLFQQVTEKPWPKGNTESVDVQAFHDGESIYFRLSWADDQADERIATGRFADACAVALPMEAGAPPESIMMGFASRMNFWYWRADVDAEFWKKKDTTPTAYADHYNPFEEKEVLAISRPKVTSAVDDLLAEGAGSLTRKERQNVQGRGVYADGRWAVVIKRKLRTDALDLDVQIAPGPHGAAFAVWDGDKGDRGARKSISDWVTVDIQPVGGSGGSTAREGEKPRARRRRGARGVVRASLFAFSLMPAAYGDEAAAPPVEDAGREIVVKARRFEYMPSRIELKKGERVTIKLVSLDVTHGFYLDGYGIQLKARPGLTGKATFTADKPGRFSFRCSETCGEFHPYMIGYLTVRPNRRFHIFVAGTVVAGLVIAGAIFFPFRRKDEEPENE